MWIFAGVLWEWASSLSKIIVRKLTKTHTIGGANLQQGLTVSGNKRFMRMFTVHRGSLESKCQISGHI